MTSQKPDNTDVYSDIIDLEYHGTITHTPMPMEKRAAQFSPFAALTGMREMYEDVTDIAGVDTTEDREWVWET